MAGSKKGKNNKKKRERSSSQKSNSKSDVGQKHRYEHDQFPQSSSDEELLADQLYKKLEFAFQEASDILMTDLNYSTSSVHTALLGGGFIIGEKNIVANILKNSICYIDSHMMADGKYVVDEVSVFEDMNELIVFWVQTLLSFAAKRYPKGTPRSELLRNILSSKMLDAMVLCRDDMPEGDEEVVEEPEFDAFLKENLQTFEKFWDTHKPGRSSNYSEGVKEPKESNPLPKDSSSDQKNSNPLFDESLPDEEWLRNSSEDGKTEMVKKLENRVRSLEGEVIERKEWAQRKGREINEKQKQYINVELNTLRMEELSSRIQALKKEKEELVHSYIAKMQTMNMDAGRDELDDELPILEKKIGELEADNAQLQANIASWEVNETELQEKMRDAMKREQENLKRSENMDRQMMKLQEQIQEEKEKITQMNQQLIVVEESQNQIKLRLQEERVEKEMANDLNSEERRLARIERENGKKRMKSLQESLEMQEKLLVDTKYKLMEELTTLKLPYLLQDESSFSSSSSFSGERFSGKGGSSSQSNICKDIPIHQRCIMCIRKEVCVLFIPCAHQVVCYDCSERIGDHCPSCHGQVAQKIRVYGASL